MSMDNLFVKIFIEMLGKPDNVFLFHEYKLWTVK